MKIGKYTVGAPFVSESYKKPTPSVMRKIGDCLLIVGSTVTSISAFTLPPIVTAIAAVATGVGKIITVCFSE